VNREAHAEHDQRQNQKHDEQSHHFLLVVVRKVERPSVTYGYAWSRDDRRSPGCHRLIRWGDERLSEAADFRESFDS
jgi:hypothetical protein